MSLGIFDEPGKRYIKQNGKTYEREDWSKNRKEIKQTGKSLTSGITGYDEYKIKKRRKYHILYVR